jgi:chromosome segregation ATPase
MVMEGQLGLGSTENPVLYRVAKSTDHDAMFVELPNELIFIASGAFLLGWILATISGNLRARHRAKKRDPRDDRIRGLEAELRIAQSEENDSRTHLEKLEDELKETTIGLERRDNVITKQQSKLDKVSSDLKESVLKTRELRSELTDRATESVHAEAKIREVETELSVAQASTDMIATGVLDYSFIPDKQDPDAEVSEDDDVSDEVSKASS